MPLHVYGPTHRSFPAPVSSIKASHITFTASFFSSVDKTTVRNVARGFLSTLVLAHLKLLVNVIKVTTGTHYRDIINSRPIQTCR